MIFDYKQNLSLLDRIRQEVIKRKEPPLLQITSKQSGIQKVISSNFALYKILRHEELQHFDEKSIFMMEKEIHQQTQHVLKLVYTFSK